jgi:hypothetical protein
MSQVLTVLNLLNHNPMKNLYDIAPEFSFVIDKGFTLESIEYKPEEFGNASLVMLGVPFSIRFERDRGQIFIDIGNDAIGWHKLEYVLEFCDNSVASHVGKPPEPKVLASLLLECWEKVIDLFSNRQKIFEFQAFAKGKSDDLINTIFGKH